MFQINPIFNKKVFCSSPNNPNSAYRANAAKSFAFLQKEPFFLTLEGLNSKELELIRNLRRNNTQQRLNQKNLDCALPSFNSHCQRTLRPLMQQYQEDIINKPQNGIAVILSAIPGAGKSTIAEHLEEYLPEGLTKKDFFFPNADEIKKYLPTSIPDNNEQDLIIHEESTVKLRQFIDIAAEKKTNIIIELTGVWYPYFKEILDKIQKYQEIHILYIDISFAKSCQRIINRYNKKGHLLDPMIAYTGLYSYREKDLRNKEDRECVIHPEDNVKYIQSIHETQYPNSHFHFYFINNEEFKENMN